MSPAHRARPRCQAIFDQAQKVLVGGVNSPVRAFKSVGGAPLIIERGAGSRLWDADGNEYLDFIGSWGAMILGHAHPAVTAAIRDQAGRGTSYGVSTELEAELARRIQSALPSMEKMRFVSSGTEATMSAIRLARAATKRDLILKFEGCYHGHGDSFLSEAGSGLATLGISASPGVPDALAEMTVNVPYNSLEAVEQAFASHRGRIAAVIVEPVAANMGVVPPGDGFLAALREITRREGALLIFDEVITGFRVAWGGAHTLYGIRPDLTTLGKIIGGGLPVGAYGGQAHWMEMVAPLGPVYQAGTLSGNPLAMRVGLETLRELSAAGVYEKLARKGQRLADGVRAAAAETGVAACVNHFGSLLTLFFTAGPVGNYTDAKKSDTQRFAAFFRAMLDRGVLLPPSQYEAWFVGAAHSDEDIDRAIVICRQSLASLQ